MPVVRNPVTQPMAAPTPVAAPVNPRTLQTTPFKDTTNTFDAASGVVRTATGVASPGKAPSIKAPKLDTVRIKDGEIRGPGLEQVAQRNASALTSTAAKNQQNTMQARQKAIKTAAQARTSGGIQSSPSVMGPSFGTVGNPADNQPDLKFMKFS